MKTKKIYKATKNLNYYLKIMPLIISDIISKKLRRKSNYKKINYAKENLYFFLKKIKNKWKISNSDLSLIIEQLSPENTVLSGPFIGMKYPSQKSYGSAIWPKILGTYEAELHSIIERICKDNYSKIVDIGCAEGYYAVGLAQRLPNARVFGFDINKCAQEMCQEMSTLNNVQDQITLSGEFSLDLLSEIPYDHKNGIIISDCEGSEHQIFDRKSIYWNILIDNYDLLIEAHEFLKPGITNHLIEIFSTSHDIEVIPSTDDLLRPMIYHLKFLDNQPDNVKIALMAEGRPQRMEWLYLKRKNLSM